MATKTALVLGGGGARGAYEAGVLAELLPQLELDGVKPTIFVGTSAGAINAAYLASRAGLAAEVATKGLVELWQNVDLTDVAHSLWTIPTFPLRMLAGRAASPDEPVGLLDVEPLRTTIDREIGSRSRLSRNRRKGVLDTLAIVASSMEDGNSVVFCDGRVPGASSEADLRYEEAKITTDYVMASAAIPVLFPPAPVGDGWYMDGGTRLNTPIKPAIDLGADRLIIVATDSDRRGRPLPPQGWYGSGAPGFEVALLHLLQGALNDPLAEDIERLQRINAVVPTSTRKDWRTIEFVFVRPEVPGEFALLAELATEDFRAGYADAQYWLLGNFIESATNYELMSYVLFERDFLGACIERGRADGAAALQRSPLWQV